VEAVPAGEINDPVWAQQMWEADVQLVAVFGSSILRSPWLERFSGTMVNLHLGLSPYYRGSGTNFWPLYDERPAFVGATVHLIDPGVDSGAILRHARPPIRTTDTPHTIGNRAIRAGARALIASLREYAAGERAPVPQWETADPRYRRGADFTPAILDEFLGRWRNGLLARALQEAPARQPERLIGEVADE
jgi:methionyl-tRNA formyltransferase